MRPDGVVDEKGRSYGWTPAGVVDETNRSNACRAFQCIEREKSIKTDTLHISMFLF